VKTETQLTGQRRLAKYWRPALTRTVRFAPKSRTFTTPRKTLVRVPLQRSSTNHLVPTTVAALRLPLVRNLPLPSPQSRRFFFFLAAALALPPPLHWRAPVSVSVVSGFLPWGCLNLKSPL
jgi:hypothetical protein